MTDEIRINPLASIPEQLPRKLSEEGGGVKKPKPESTVSEEMPTDSLRLSQEALDEQERLRNESK